MDLNKLNVLLEKEGIEETVTNQYIFIMFFLERCQHIGNLINLIDPQNRKSIIYGIKYNILYNKEFKKISEKIKEFKKEFSKDDLINEILSFIKSSIGSKKIDDDIIPFKKKKDLDNLIVPKFKIKKIINSFENLNNFIKETNDIKENDIYSYLTETEFIVVSELNCIKLERDLTKIDIEWIRFKRSKNHPNKCLFEILKPWFKL